MKRIFAHFFLILICTTSALAQNAVQVSALPIAATQRNPKVAAKQALPKYALVYRIKFGSILNESGHAVHAEVFETLEELTEWAEREGIDEDRLIGVWELGQPLEATATATAPAPTQKKSRVQVRKP